MEKERYRNEDCVGFIRQVNYKGFPGKTVFNTEKTKNYAYFKYGLHEVSLYTTIHVVAIFKIKLKPCH